MHRISASWHVQCSVFLMIFGALVAASQDLAFSLSGYTYVSLNNVLTASNGVYLKKKLDAKDLGKNGLLYYNSLFMIPFAFLLAWWSGDIEAVSVVYRKVRNAKFFACFVCLYLSGPGISILEQFLVSYPIYWFLYYGICTLLQYSTVYPA